MTIDELKERAGECMNVDKCLFCSWSRDVWCTRKIFAREAMETIQQLEAAQPKWISVEERLPEDDVNVLAYIASKKENVDSVIAITRYTHSMHGFNIEGWCSPWKYCFWDREVTHWMPLPSAPDETTTPK